MRIGEAVAPRSNDVLLHDYFTDEYRLHSPAGDLNRDQIKAYFAALRESCTNFTINGAQMFVDANFVTARTVMASRFDKAFACTPVGTVEPSGRPARWESFAARPLRAAMNAGKELGFTASHALAHTGHVKFAA